MKGKRTMIFALIVEIFGILEAFDWTQVMDSQKAGKIVMAMGLLIAVFRSITDSPLFGSIGGGGVDDNDGGSK